MANNLSALALQDCMTVQKAFERGASFATTEESVFALMRAYLTGMRAQTANVATQIENGNSVAADSRFDNMERGTEDDPSTDNTLQENWVPGGDKWSDFGGVFDSKCIPCEFRLETFGQLTVSGANGFKNSVLDHWKQWLSMFLKQLMQLKELFSLPKNTVDVCALIKFFLDFMCVPDLQKMISILMALMGRVNFEFGGIIDLIIGLIAPLLQPFLSNIVDMLTDYILMIVKPIECIIRSIQGLISKLDYNVLFQNIEGLDKNISLGRRQGSKTGTGGESLTASVNQMRKDVPGVAVVVPNDVDVETNDVHSGPDRHLEYDFNLLGPAATAIKKDNAKKQKAVEEAHKELQDLQGRNPSGLSEEENERYGQQVETSKNKYNSAVEDRDLSALGRMNARLDDTLTGFQSMIFSVISKLKQAISAVEGFFNSIFDELKKIMGEFIGGGGSFIEIMFEKMQLIQLISLISSIIDFIGRGLQCDDDEDDKIKLEKFISPSQGMSIWTDEAGNVHIEEGDAEVLKAIEEAVKIIGASANYPQPATEAALQDKGAVPFTTDSRQKLKSLIEFTGDPVLDTSIARATEAIITPIKISFRCPLTTSVDQTEQVNEWIKELDNT